MLLANCLKTKILVVLVLLRCGAGLRDFAAALLLQLGISSPSERWMPPQSAQKTAAAGPAAPYSDGLELDSLLLVLTRLGQRPKWSGRGFDSHAQSTGPRGRSAQMEEEEANRDDTRRVAHGREENWRWVRPNKQNGRLRSAVDHAPAAPINLPGSALMRAGRDGQRPLLRERAPRETSLHMKRTWFWSFSPSLSQTTSDACSPPPPACRASPLFRASPTYRIAPEPHHLMLMRPEPPAPSHFTFWRHTAVTHGLTGGEETGAGEAWGIIMAFVRGGGRDGRMAVVTAGYGPGFASVGGSFPVVPQTDHRQTGYKGPAPRPPLHPSLSLSSPGFFPQSFIQTHSFLCFHARTYHSFQNKPDLH
jgi:hypothetical protein